jgi:hypothetical protein
VSATALIGVLVTAAASGGRAVAIPLLAVAQGLSRLVSKRLAHDIEDVRVALQHTTDAEAKAAEAAARIKVIEAIEAENRLTDTRRQEAAHRLREARAAKAEAEVRGAEAQAAKTAAEARLIEERAAREAIVNKELELARAIVALRAKGGGVFVDVESLQKLLAAPTTEDVADDAASGSGSQPPEPRLR